MGLPSLRENGKEYGSFKHWEAEPKLKFRHMKKFGQDSDKRLQHFNSLDDNEHLLSKLI